MSKASFHVHLILPEGRTHSSQFDNLPSGFTALDAWLAKHCAGILKAAVEATGNYALALLMHLHQAGHQISYLNPRRVKDFAKTLGRKIKTDPTDAKLIAMFIERVQPTAWTPPSAQIVELQALVRLRHDLVVQLTATRNRRHSALVKMVQTSLDRQIKSQLNEIARIDKLLEALVLKHTDLQKSLRLLRSIPGIGRIVALTILAEVPHITTFERARDAAAFAGVTPCVVQSGSTVRGRGRMSKEGSALLRKALYMSALNVIRRSNALQKTYLNLVERGKAKACSLGALMNKLMRIAFGVLKHQTPFIDNFAQA